MAIVVSLVTVRQRALARSTAEQLFKQLTPEARWAWWSSEVSFAELFGESLGKPERYALGEMISTWIEETESSS